MRLFGVILDETARLAADRALAEARGRLDAALTAAEVGVWEYDPATGSIGADANLAAMFGLDPEKGRHAPAEILISRIHPEDQPRVAEAFGRAATEGTVYDVAYRTVVGPRVRHLIARGFAERGESGKVVRMPGAVLDVTSTALAEAREREAEETFRTVFEQAPDTRSSFWTSTARLLDRAKGGATPRDETCCNISDIGAARPFERENGRGPIANLSRVPGAKRGPSSFLAPRSRKPRRRR